MKQEELEKLKEKVKQEKERRKKAVFEYWKNRLPFLDEDDIPDIPIVDKDKYEEIIIPNIIRCGGIPKEGLVVGKTYIGSCRNASEAIWDGEKFTYMRTKFGYTYPEDINHFQDDDGYDLFVPIKVKED